MKQISEKISYIEASEEPLSANVAVIRGAKEVWLYDVGAGNKALMEINGIAEPKNVVISHFHPDHIGNLSKTEYRSLYVSRNTFRYTETGTIITGSMTADDGETKIRVFPIPSSHAKGSLAMEVDDRYIFIGDAFYPTVKGGKKVYNRQLLWDGLRLLRSCAGTQVCVSHAEPFVIRKTDLIAYFEKVYALKADESPYIEVP